jgi:hypothetical protein
LIPSINEDHFQLIYINQYIEIQKIFEFQYLLITDPIIGFRYLPEIQQEDLARDGHHYDIKTATTFVDKLVNLIDFLQKQ